MPNHCCCAGHVSHQPNIAEPTAQTIWSPTNLAIEILHQGTQRDLEKFCGVAWWIWYNRNQVLYEANGTSETHIWGAAIRMIEDFKEANGLKIKHMRDKKDH